MNRLFYFPFLLTAVALFYFVCNVQAQNNETPFSTGYHYKMIVEAAIYECDILGNKVSPAKLRVAPGKAVFSKIGETEDGQIIIRFWRWPDDQSDKQQQFNFTDSSGQNRKYFLMSKADFEAKAIPRYSTRARFSAGTIVVPVKARFNSFDFSTDVHLGPSAGARFRLSPYTNENFFNAVATFGVSTIGLDSLNTQGRVLQNSDRPALTFTIGGVLEFSNAQIGLFFGWDYISQNNTNNWIYQGKPWLSLGLGYTIMSQNSSQQPQVEGTQK